MVIVFVHVICVLVLHIAQFSPFMLEAEFIFLPGEWVFELVNWYSGYRWLYRLLAGQGQCGFGEVCDCHVVI